MVGYPVREAVASDTRVAWNCGERYVSGLCDVNGEDSCSRSLAHLELSTIRDGQTERGVSGFTGCLMAKLGNEDVFLSN